MNTTQTNEAATESNPVDLLTEDERMEMLAALERLPVGDREEMAVTGMTIAWMVDFAKHVIAWRGAR